MEDIQISMPPNQGSNSTAYNRDANDTTLTSSREQWQSVYRSQFRRFLEEFKEETENENTDLASGRDNAAKYERRLLHAVEMGLKSLFVDIQDLRHWGDDGDDLANFIQHHFLETVEEVDSAVEAFSRDTCRKFNLEAGEERDQEKYSACFFNISVIHTVRTLRCDSIGKLISIKATVTRTSDIRPELRVAAFECDTCGAIVPNVIQHFKYTEPAVCPFKECGNRVKWNLKHESCIFSDWQKIRVQENASEIPAGSMPRAIDIIVRNDICDRCKAGDKVLVTGCLIAVPDVPALLKPGQVPKSVARDKTRRERSEFGLQDNAIRGLRNLGVRDLGYRLCFLGSHVRITNTVAEDDAQQSDSLRQTEEEGPFGGLSLQEEEVFRQIAESSNCLERLSRCMAPEVYGHEEIKKGLLLMMVGGVEKRTEKEEIKLRGDINVCVVGDPGTAKSQMLKFVQAFARRAVYTSGKSSTAAGLTASVHKDLDQGDSVIEAGALMLADKGICCIDEFDKMDEKDMAAIHEAMEQQTISIAKAGIQATLNARASVLAACNPSGGRYDPSRTFRQNVRLSAPIMSRFDLFFVMVDDTDQDEIVARHMVKMHATMGQWVPLGNDNLFGRQQLQTYIRIARTMRPKLSDEAKDVLKNAWITLRQQDTQPGSTRNVRITVRQLESLIRLSEAVTKLRFQNEVLATHVHEAFRLYHNSLTKVRKSRIDLADDVDDDDEDDEDNDADLNGESSQINGNPRARLPGESDAAFQARRREDLCIPAEEYERIAQLLVDYLRSQQRHSVIAAQEHQPSEEFPVVTRDALVTWYLDANFDTDCEDELSREYRKLVRIVNRMVNRDYTLIEEHREVELEVGGTVDVQTLITLRLHPNFTNYDSSYSASTRTHANLSSQYYSEQAVPENSAGVTEGENWVGRLADDEFSQFLDTSRNLVLEDDE